MKVDSKNIEILAEYFKDKPVLKAFLFGSIVKDYYTDDSDIDILVELDYSEPIGLKFIQMQMDLENLLNKDVDLVSSNGLSDYIKPFIEQEKILIYAR
ncbi:MAG: nucleotidyltransferase domain-containing protein [Bacteroidales bacterium]|nr:nucleotidyltransferase domain-containing protein [Bacteroidales bacterium]